MVSGLIPGERVHDHIVTRDGYCQSDLWRRAPHTWGLDIGFASRIEHLTKPAEADMPQTMHSTSRLTDRNALIRNRRRARQSGCPTLFLHEEVASEIKQRLPLVNRTFTAPAVITGWPEVWTTELLGAKCVEDTESLDLDVGFHDLVIHCMALHWAEDAVAQLIQARRALKPDGLFLAALPGGRTLYELRSSLAEAEVRLSDGLSPRVVPMAEIRDLGSLLQRAGFALPVADSVSHRVTYSGPLELMRDLRSMGEANAMAARSRQFTNRSVFTEAERCYRNAFPNADGRIVATFEIIYLAGWAPDSSQQKPLRPGSASRRLAEALNVGESILPG